TLAFRRDRKAWEAFCRHQFWEEVGTRGTPKRFKRKSRALRYVIRFLTQAVAKSTRRVVAKQARALHHLLRQGTSVSGLPVALAEAGGIEAVARQAARARAASCRNKEATSASRSRSSSGERTSGGNRSPSSGAAMANSNANDNADRRDDGWDDGDTPAHS